MAITYDEIAEHAWKQILEINTAASRRKDLKSFLNDNYAESIIRHQFDPSTTPHIKNLYFVAKNPIPTPKLEKLAKDFGYTGLTAKDKLLKDVETDLGTHTSEALKAFDKGGFLGIAYDRTVWVLKNEMIDTVLHEIVHTLQWAHFRQEPFLSRYIKGFSQMIKIHGISQVAYMENPAEKQAYDYQKKFLKSINTALSAKPPYTLILGPTMTSMQTAGGVSRSKRDVERLVTNQGSLNVNTATAISGIR